jgi:hypothetical protein
VPLAVRRFDDHARDAAVLLGWFGMTILMIGAPLVTVLSRRALFILLPIGAGLMFAAFLVSVSRDGLKALRQAVATPLGLAVVFLAGWMGLSLVWTPFPEAAGPRYAAMVSVVVIAAIIIAFLPERRARPSLYLLPAGLVFTAALTLGMTLFGPASFRGGSEFDSSLLERSILTLVLLVWPALGALGVFGRWTLATALASLVALAIVVTSAQNALATFAIAAVTFAMAATDPKRAARIAAGLFGTLILLAPLLPFLLAPLAQSVDLVGKSTIAAMTDWRDLVTADGVRLLTGHGLDTARRGVVYGYLPAHTPRTILFEIWYELGVLGAVGLAAVFALATAAAGNAAATVAPALLAGLVATVVVAIFGIATAQLWFVTMCGLEAVAFGLLCRSSRGQQRPVAVALDTARPAADPR